MDVIYTYLDFLTSGRILRAFFKWLYRVVGAIWAILGLLLAIGSVSIAFKWFSFVNAFQALILVVTLVAGSYILMVLSFYRAKSIAELTEHDYTAIPIISVFLKYLGEVVFVVLTLTALTSLLLALIPAKSGIPSVAGNLLLDFGHLTGKRQMIGIFEHGGSFLSSLAMVISEFVSAIFTLLLFYGLSEATLAMAEIASNTRVMRHQREASGTVAQSIPAQDEPSAAPVERSCPSCGAPCAADDLFCGECGTKLP